MIVDIPEASLTQVDDAVAAAVAAFDRWSRTTPAERSLMLLKLADRIEVNAEDYAALEALNCGKPLAPGAAGRNSRHCGLHPVLCWCHPLPAGAGGGADGLAIRQ